MASYCAHCSEPLGRRRVRCSLCVSFRAEAWRRGVRPWLLLPELWCSTECFREHSPSAAHNVVCLAQRHRYCCAFCGRFSSVKLPACSECHRARRLFVTMAMAQGGHEAALEARSQILDHMNVHYCNRTCQSAQWPAHKANCCRRSFSEASTMAPGAVHALIDADFSGQDSASEAFVSEEDIVEDGVASLW